MDHNSRLLRAYGLPDPMVEDILEVLEHHGGPGVDMKVETNPNGRKTLHISPRCNTTDTMGELFRRVKDDLAVVSCVSLGPILEFLGADRIESLRMYHGPQATLNIVTRRSNPAPAIDWLDWFLGIMRDYLPNIQFLQYGGSSFLAHFLQGIPYPERITKLTFLETGFGTAIDDPQVLFGRMPQLRELVFMNCKWAGMQESGDPQFFDLSITDEHRNLLGNMIRFLPQLDTLGLKKGMPMGENFRNRLIAAILAHPNLKNFKIFQRKDFIQRTLKSGTLEVGRFPDVVEAKCRWGNELYLDDEAMENIFNHLLLNRAKAHLAQGDEQQALATVRFHVPLLFELLRDEMDPSVYAINAANNLSDGGPWERWIGRHLNTSKGHQARLEEQNKKERLDPSSMFFFEG